MQKTHNHGLPAAFQAILDYLPSGFSLIDKKLNLIAWNEEFKRLLEFPDELFAPGPPNMADLFRYNALRGDYGPGDPDELIHTRISNCSLMQPHVFERVRPDGTILEIRGTPLPNGGFVTIYTDITQRKQAETKYRATLENASVGIIFTKSSKVEHCNPLAAQIFGWDSTHDLIGQPGSVFWASSDFYTEIGKQAGPILASGKIFDIECMLRRKNGSTFLGHLSAKAVNSTLTSEGTIWIAEDVTEKRSIERAIKESERRLSQIVDGNSIPTFVIDAEHRITHWNQACAKLTGLSREDVLGRTDAWRAFYKVKRPTLADLVVSDEPNEIIGGHYGKHARSTLIADAYEAEEHFPQMGEGGLWLFLTAASLRDSEGRITGTIETLQDVTSRKLAEKSLEDRTEALQKAYSELGQVLKNLQDTQDELVRSEKLAALGAMVAGVAHELNTPIGNSLMVASHVLKASARINDAVKSGLKRSMLEEFLSDITSASDILVRNLNKAAELVSSFKQVAVDQTSSLRRRFKLEEIVTEISTVLAPSIRKTPYLLTHQIPAEISLDSFPGPLGQVLTNLINNAILHGFSGRGHGTINISAALRAAENEVTLTVIDDGLGIPTETLPRIFDPFFTTRQGSGGTGLGLNITHNIVTGILGGRIGVSSVVGQGACFSIVIPLSAPEKIPEGSRNSGPGCHGNLSLPSDN